MVIRLACMLVLGTALASTSSAQFFGFGPLGPGNAFGPPGPGDLLGPGSRPDRISIRSPFFRMELSPYGGNYSTPYSSFSVPVPPPPFPGVSPRGWRSPYFNNRPDFDYGTRDSIAPAPPSDFAPDRPLAPRYAEPSQDYAPDGEYRGQQDFSPLGPSILQPDPVPPPQYDVPSFSEVFPNESGDQQLSSAVRIANQLQRAVDRLTKDLSSRESGDVWSEYLRLADVERFANQLARQNDFATSQFDSARELAVNFDAAASSPDLDWLQAAPGFENLRSTLNAIITAADSDVPSEQVAPADGNDSFEDLPAPTPKPVNKTKRVFRAEI